MRNYWTRYLPVSIRSWAYMLQTSDYNMVAYWHWVMRVGDMRQVSRRGTLVMTTKARLVIVWLAIVYVATWLLILYMVIAVSMSVSVFLIITVLGLLVALPWLVSVSIIPVVWLGEACVQRPRARRMIAEATQRVAAHPGYKIAIAGSYGKTTMKETLKTILSVKLDTAATPGNLNTPLGTAKFVGQLGGEEEVVIFELGESHVGDVAELAAITQPDMGVITGINQAHLESFGSIERTVDTIFELEEYLGNKPLYKNADSSLVGDRVKADDELAYSQDGVHGWRVSNIRSDVTGTRFTAQRGKLKLELHSGLLGEHQVGPIMTGVDIAQQLGLSPEQIAEGVAHTKPFAHRMAPRQLAGAWIIDDTYNGNPEGVRAGLAFLAGLDATRKVYVTPGLVEQGKDTEKVHVEIGRQAAFCHQVVLMQNSVTQYIKQGLDEAGFTGDLRIVEEPLKFYQNLARFVSAGDVVLMQNDWTDNYV